MKRLITLTSTKGKTPEQIHQELTKNLAKYQKAQPKQKEMGLAFVPESKPQKKSSKKS